jgi:hypothetical protein
VGKRKLWNDQREELSKECRERRRDERCGRIRDVGGVRNAGGMKLQEDEMRMRVTIDGESSSPSYRLFESTHFHITDHFLRPLSPTIHMSTFIQSLQC